MLVLDKCIDCSKHNKNEECIDNIIFCEVTLKNHDEKIKRENYNSGYSIGCFEGYKTGINKSIEIIKKNCNICNESILNTVKELERLTEEE